MPFAYSHGSALPLQSANYDKQAEHLNQRQHCMMQTRTCSDPMNSGVSIGSAAQRCAVTVRPMVQQHCQQTCRTLQSCQPIITVLVCCQLPVWKHMYLSQDRRKSKPQCIDSCLEAFLLRCFLPYMASRTSSGTCFTQLLSACAQAATALSCRCTL